MAKKTTSDREATEQFVVVQRLERAIVEFYLLGTSPLVMNRMAAKAKQQLLLPRRTMNKAAREAVLKHEPVPEFRDSIYRCRDDSAPTYIHVPGGALKKALAQAAIDTPGATKAAVGRLVKVIDTTVYLYGKPYLYMDTVRLQGINKTPDIRTRAMFPRWALKVTMQYQRTLIREQDVVNLMANAGDITGIGDGRTEKGTFNNGSWDIVNADDAQWNEIVRTEGRAVQLEAMENPEAIDADTAELLDWYNEEIIRREVQKKDKLPDAAVIAATKETGNGKKLPRARGRHGTRAQP